jgi:hypothetical protein
LFQCFQEAVEEAVMEAVALAALVASLVWEEALAEVEEHSQAVVLQKPVMRWLGLASL